MTNSQNPKKINELEKLSYKLTSWVGTPHSIIAHSLFFGVALALAFSGFNPDRILLILTTVVSLEAIYLSIFIQMTVNRNTESLEEVEEDIEDIQEDVAGLEDDLEDIQEEDKKDEEEDKKAKTALKNIEGDIDKLLEDIQTLKKDVNSSSTKKFLNG